MNDRIHLLMAITLSMVMTFTFYYFTEGKQASNSIYQQYHVDPIHTSLLYIRCQFHNQKGMCLRKDELNPLDLNCGMQRYVKIKLFYITFFRG